jgi:hypothetical protein
VADSLACLLDAEDRDHALAAARQLVSLARQDGWRPEQAWNWLASQSTAGLLRADYSFAARAGLAALLWNEVFLANEPSLAKTGLAPVGSAGELQLLINCFEACTHLPERSVLAQDSQTVCDVEMIRNRCQGRLSELPVAQYLTTVARPARRTAVPPPVADPATEYIKPGAEPHAMTNSKVFISYVREDSAAVDRIAEALRAQGINAWLDRTHITPGERWQLAISDAIRSGTYFIACFSPSYAQRGRTYMNEELRIAIEQLRLMPLSRRWFIPVILRPCEIPDFQIDAVERLRNFQHIDFSQDWDSAIAQLIKAVSLLGNDHEK